jgi:NAD(P)-dependent dehydrogenase (short-subunit alcohol dehydrogenase family)
MTAQQTILVTGGASGVGFAIVQAIREQCWGEVVADAGTNSDDAVERTCRLARMLMWVRRRG